MAMSKRHIWVLAIIVLSILGNSIQVRGFNCSEVIVDNFKFDLHLLDNEYIVNSTHRADPSEKIKEFHISPCSPLKYNDTIDSRAQCPNGTYVCEYVKYKLYTNETVLVKVKPIAGEYPDDNRFVNPLVTLGPMTNNDGSPSSFDLTLHGGKSNDDDYKTNITFYCDEEHGGPIVKGFEHHTLQIDWRSVHACGTRISQPDSGGRSWFSKFLIFVFAVGSVYLFVGIAYNRHVYNAQGWDLIPHRDFWREVPYIAKEFMGYVFNSLRKGGRPGYHHVGSTYLIKEETGTVSSITHIRMRELSETETGDKIGALTRDSPSMRHLCK
ncbi:5491_t:CDS:2 [Paraglomus occultum]|uniref:Autophagy-related protein 27 n=1 Tax=Paraglomus occultum TaxID=144539 RepID=A0A9N8ZBP4_9GLOM|nr:5491_t:CDS:2 [Paraglomus occultum]